MVSANKQFTNFKVHSQYSICEGAIKIEDLSNFCKDNKVKSIGLCDSFNLCGALEFAEKISKNGTHPIIGTQINFAIDGVIGKLPLFATSHIGYKNLIKLSSKSYLDSNEKSDPHCDFKILKSFNNELILLTGGHIDLFGVLFKLNKLKQIEHSFKEVKSIFGDKFYIEIQRHNEPGEEDFENYIIKLSDKLNIPLIASQEIYYLNQDMHEAHDALICIGKKNFVEDTKRIRFSKEHYPRKN